MIDTGSASINFLILTIGWPLIIIAAIAASIVLLMKVWKSISNRRETLRAAAEAQIALDSDELDLDRRLGPKNYIPIESKLYPNSSTNAQVPIQLAYRQTGHGPDILCLHGIGASMIIYRRLVPWLTNSYRVTCLDFPGFGSSEKPRTYSYSLDEQATHLDQAVRALKLDRPLVVASSMGSAIALKSALENPTLFRGIVALGPAVDPKRVPLGLLPLAKFGDALHRINTPTAMRAILSQVIARRELITPALVALYQEPFRENSDSSSAFLKAFSLLADARMPKIFKNLKTPLLIIRGLGDRLVKQAACEDLHRVVETSTLITHPTAGHHIMEDEPEFVALEVRRFDGTGSARI